jgi:hypothetical protein
MSCLHNTNHSTFIHLLDHVHEEPESEVQVEEVQAEETNTDLDQGKPRCIPQIILDFDFNHYLMLRLIVH